MKINRDSTSQTFVQLLKYGVIGVSNTAITWIAFFLLNSLAGWPYTLANVVGYVLGVVNSFIWNRTWVFKGEHSSIRREASLFVLGFLLCWGLQMGVSAILLEGFDMKHFTLEWIPNAGQNIVMLIGMVFYTLANYCYNRLVTFK